MKVCHNCKQTNPIEAMFCRQCASPLGASQPQQQYANQQQQFGQHQQQFNQGNICEPPIQSRGQSNSTGGASSRATTAAILAVAGTLCCFGLGLVAAILGWLEIQAIKEGKSPQAGMTMAQVGLWLGIAGTVINAFVWFFLTILGSLGGM